MEILIFEYISVGLFRISSPTPKYFFLIRPDKNWAITQIEICNNLILMVGFKSVWILSGVLIQTFLKRHSEVLI